MAFTKPKDNTFSIEFSKFYQGFSPLAFKNSLTEFGNAGNASVMTNVDSLNGDYVTQGPGLINLTNGTQAGAVTELINFIYDKAVSSYAYGIGNTKLFQISSTTVTSNASFPYTISGSTQGSSTCVLKGYLYYFYNTVLGGDIGRYNLITTFSDNWGSTSPNGAATLNNAPHPSDAKEDIMVFGNGRYLGVYINTGSTLYPQKLDFGNDAEVDDVIFNANQWVIAVNKGTSGRQEGQIYFYDGGALSTLLADEAGVGMQKIGFLYRLNGIVYAAYQDTSSTGFKIGYLYGRQLVPLGSFTGYLPTFQQKTLYKNTIIFLSSGVWSAGAVTPDLPVQISQLAGTGYSTVGALAAPFGTPMIASSSGANYRLAQFSGYNTNSSWKSIVIPLSARNYRGYIDEVVVQTSSLGAGARCDLTLEADQATTISSVKQITGLGLTRFSFRSLGLNKISDFRVALDFSNGSTVNPCNIRKINVIGHFVK